LENAVCVSVRVRDRSIDGQNSVNIEPALQTNSTSSSSHDNGRSTADGPGSSGRVETISFSIGDEQYGVDIMAVREIKGWSEITLLPKQPDYVRGVLNLRGVMVPIIDLRCRFGQGKTEATPLHVVIVVQVEARLVGLLADRVLDILAFEASQVQPVPQVARASSVGFLSGLITIDGTMIALVDLQNLLADEQFMAADAAADAAASATAKTF
jgi:purine-binding chemotaxis protein CheW